MTVTPVRIVDRSVAQLIADWPLKMRTSLFAGAPLGSQLPAVLNDVLDVEAHTRVAI